MFWGPVDWIWDQLNGLQMGCWVALVIAVVLPTVDLFYLFLFPRYKILQKTVLY